MYNFLTEYLEKFMQPQVNFQQCVLLHTVRNQNNKSILHLTFFIMTCSKCVKYVFFAKENYSYL